MAHLDADKASHKSAGLIPGIIAVVGQFRFTAPRKGSKKEEESPSVSGPKIYKIGPGTLRQRFELDPNLIYSDWQILKLAFAECHACILRYLWSD